MHIRCEETIKAPIASVFEVFSDVTKLQDKIEAVKSVEIVSDVREGKGVRWRETREIFGKEATEEMEITSFDPPRSYEVTSALSNGVIYKTVYRFEESDSQTKVAFDFSGAPQTLAAKLFAPIFGLFFKRMTEKLLKKDMQELKAILENPGETSGKG